MSTELVPPLAPAARTTAPATVPATVPATAPATAPARRWLRADPRSWERARVAVTVALLTGLVGLAVTVGADARWLAALGAVIVRRGGVPAGVPFAAAPQAHWANPLVLAELAFHLLETSLGDRGLILAQLACVAAALAIAAADALATARSRGGARAWAVPAALALVTIGALPSFAIARVQMFSLVLFPALVALLRAESRRRSRRIWLALPLLALWSNLHGAVLSGLLVLAVYLVLDRIRHQRVTALMILIAAPLAICVNPAGLGEARYLQGLVTSVAAQRGAGMWGPLGSSPFDPVTVVAAVLLAIGIARSARPRLWELVVLAILAALTVKAARDGVWLLLFMLAPSIRTARARKRSARTWNGLVPVGAVLALMLLVVATARVPRQTGASRQAVAAAIRLAAGRPILADAIPAEQLALAGAQIWVGDPLDAFTRATQVAYLDWIAGTATRAALGLEADPRIGAILVSAGSAAARLAAADPALVAADSDATAIVFVRRRPA
jgi:hypothetical protein